MATRNTLKISILGKYNNYNNQFMEYFDDNDTEPTVVVEMWRTQFGAGSNIRGIESSVEKFIPMSKIKHVLNNLTLSLVSDDPVERKLAKLIVKKCEE